MLIFTNILNPCKTGHTVDIDKLHREVLYHIDYVIGLLIQVHRILSLVKGSIL